MADDELESAETSPLLTSTSSIKKDQKQAFYILFF
jgi:hypothetical protein